MRGSYIVMHGTYMIRHGTNTVAHGTNTVVHGTDTVVHGTGLTRYEHGTNSQAYSIRSDEKRMVPGPKAEDLQTTSYDEGICRFW
jgi:hypothetical protein